MGDAGLLGGGGDNPDLARWAGDFMGDGLHDLEAGGGDAVVIGD